jgi:hypothetical protein
MQLSNETIAILKHFASIYAGIVIDPGNVIMIRSSTTAAVAECPDTFPTTITIANSRQFLRIMDMVQDADVEFNADHALITSADKTQSITFYYSDPRIVEQSNKPIKMPDADVTFTITKEAFAKVFSAASNLSVSDICIRRDGSNIVIEVSDKKSTTSNCFRYIVGEYEWDKDFAYYFKRDNLKLTDNTFEVAVSSKGIAQFTAVDSTLPSLKFWVAVEADAA